MVMTSNDICNIIGYKKNKRGDLVIAFECVKCKKVISKIIKNNNINTICCSDCNFKFSFIPKEYNDKLIDFYVIEHQRCKKLLRNKELALLLKDKTDIKDKNRIKYKYILNLLNKGEKRNGEK